MNRVVYDCVDPAPGMNPNSTPNSDENADLAQPISSEPKVDEDPNHYDND
jgi:hypothetical protein